MQISVQLARTKEEYEQALALLHGGRRELGFSQQPEDQEGLWLTKHHALPSTNTIVALKDGAVIGALTLFGESAFRLPLEEQADLSSFRQNLEGRVAEFSVPGLRDEFRQNRDVLLALYHYALCFGSTYCNYDAFVTQVPEPFAERYRSLLRYEPLLLKEKIPGIAFYRSAREGADFRRAFSPDFEASFQFPERKFFLVAHQSLDPKVLNYLFNQRTRLFDRLTDLELRVLKNYYAHGEYAKLLPERPLRIPFKKIPLHRRFPMNCEGHLCRGNGHRVTLQVLDASREGMKVRAGEALKINTVYPVTIEIGIKRHAEVIAIAVWVDEEAQIAGLQVKSGDKNWESLIEYLECDFLRAVV